MSYPNEIYFNNHLIALLEEYFSFAKEKIPSDGDPKLLRFDFFIKQPKQSLKPLDWHLALLIDDGQKHCLTDSSLNILCRYDKILPMFDISEDEETVAAVLEFQEQLLKLKHRPSYEKIETASLALRALCSPFRSFSTAYMVRENGLYGVVDPFGKVLIAPKYQQIKPFAFRELFWYPTVSGGPPYGGIWGETGLYLCTEDPKQLNTMDVFDLDGNCIFERIANLYPHEESLITPRVMAEADNPFLPTQKDVRGIWVSTLAYESPFPEDPQFQILGDKTQSYTVHELYANQGSTATSLRKNAVKNTSLWTRDFRHYQTEHHLSALPEKLWTILNPMICQISAHTEYSPEEIIQRLPDYADFKWERTPIRFDVENVTPDTGLDEFDLKLRTYNCLKRAGVLTAKEILELPDEVISGLKGATPKVIREITALKKYLLRAISN